MLPRYKRWSEDTPHVKGKYTETLSATILFQNICEPSTSCFGYSRCQSLREEKWRKEQEEKEAQKRAEEEERRRREEEEEEARRKAEEEEERRRLEEEIASRKAEEEEAMRREEEEELARIAQEAEKNLVIEPQTREDPDIELITEEMLDDNLSVQETEEEVNSSSQTEEEQANNGELEDVELEVNGTPAEAGPQLDEKEDKDSDNQTPGESISEPVLSPDGVNALKPSTTGEGLNKKSPSHTTASSVNQKKVKTPVSKGQLSKSQEKREQRRRRGLEHNQRETERASSSVSSSSSKDDMSPPKNTSQETSRLKERVDSKELDQYTFVAWKMKEDKGAKQEATTSPSDAPVRPSTLSLQPMPERNGVGDGAGSINLQRRHGAIKEKPEKWRGRRSDGELYEGTSSPQSLTQEERRKKPPL